MLRLIQLIFNDFWKNELKNPIIGFLSNHFLDVHLNNGFATNPMSKLIFK